MKVLIIEDDDAKFAELSRALLTRGVNVRAIARARTVGDFLRGPARSFDLCIIDLWMPLVEGGEPRDAAHELIALLQDACGFSVPLLVVTSFFAEAKRHIELFASKGCVIFDYAQKHIWQSSLDVYLAQARDRHRYEFMIFAALPEERRAYLMHDGVRIDSVARGGVDFWDFDWAERRGTVVLLPRPGLINAATEVARVLSGYAPRVVCMSGICGGIGEGAPLGRLLITDVCWEYQSGKWFDEYFSAEPYQVRISPDMRLFLSKELEDLGLVDSLEEGFAGGDRPARSESPVLAVFASGSAVIASEARLAAIKQQHRKVSGVDMEVYGFHSACELTLRGGVHFSCKVVVDRADKEKDDRLHSYGCFISSKFTLKMLRDIFEAKLPGSASLLG